MICHTFMQQRSDSNLDLPTLDIFFSPYSNHSMNVLPESFHYNTLTWVHRICNRHCKETVPTLQIITISLRETGVFFLIQKNISDITTQQISPSFKRSRNMRGHWSLSSEKIASGRHGMSDRIHGTRREPILLGLDAAGFLSISRIWFSISSWNHLTLQRMGKALSTETWSVFHKELFLLLHLPETSA